MNARATKSRQKKKSGCRTCKIRKVKCDESFPICQRCLSTGRICDGYGIWGGGSQTRAKHSGDSCTNLGLISRQTFRTAVSTDEQRSLDWFGSRTAIKLPGAFSSIFWSKTLFQASTTEPAVLHAVVALSSTHMRACLDSIDRRESKILTLQQYVTAMDCLRSYPTGAKASIICATLISCLVFIYLELLQSRYQAAILHLEHGLNLIRVNHHAGGEIGEGEAASIDGQIDDMFGRLYIQARLLGQKLRLCWSPSQDTIAYVNPKILATNNDARRCLDLIIFGIVSLRDEFLELHPKPDTKTYSRLHANQLGLSTKLSTWLEAYNPTFHKDTDRPIQLEYFAQRLLHLYHTVATIMVTAAISDDETIYDSCTMLFSSIIVQSTELYKLAFAKRSTESKYAAAFKHDFRKRNTSADSVVDIGTVAPLYFVALKCRHWKIRTRAIRLLKAAPHKEGILDSHLAAMVAEKVSEIEGQSSIEANHGGVHDLSDILNVGEEKPPQLKTSTGKRALVRDVKVNLPEGKNGLLTLWCYCGPLNNTQCYEYVFDTATQTWSD